MNTSSISNADNRVRSSGGRPCEAGAPTEPGGEIEPQVQSLPGRKKAGSLWAPGLFTNCG